MATIKFPGVSLVTSDAYIDASVYTLVVPAPSPETQFFRNVTFNWVPRAFASLAEAGEAYEFELNRSRPPKLRMGVKQERVVGGMQALTLEMSHEIPGPRGPFKITRLQLLVPMADRMLSVAFTDTAEEFGAHEAEREAMIASVRLDG